MTSGWSPPDESPVGRGMVEPKLATVGYPDEYRPSGPTSPAGNPLGSLTAESTSGTARHEAGEIAETAKDACAHVVQSAKEQVGQVTQEAGRQARDLIDQLRTEATDQAATQQQRAAGGLRSLADELSGMAHRSEQDGPATDLARQAAGRLKEVAQWLEHRHPGDVLDEVRSFARQRPGAYLALAAGAGLLAGRLSRGLAASDEEGTGSSRRPGPPPAGPDRFPEMPTADDVLERSVAAAAPLRAPASVGLTEQPVSPFPAPVAGRAGDIPR